MQKQSAKELILKTLKGKSSMKQDVYHNTQKKFKQLKSILKEKGVELASAMKSVDNRITIEYTESGRFEARLKFAGDVIVFIMHTNVFNFDVNHNMFKTSYIQDDNQRSYCGMITMHNFLADSFRYNRLNDAGYLVARLFINKENHYFVEGKRQLGFLYNDFQNALIDNDAIKSIIESAILYTLDFDLLTPHYDDVKEVSVNEMQEASQNMLIKTGKRMGFSFEADNDNFE